MDGPGRRRKATARKSFQVDRDVDRRGQHVGGDGRRVGFLGRQVVNYRETSRQERR